MLSFSSLSAPLLAASVSPWSQRTAMNVPFVAAIFARARCRTSLAKYHVGKDVVDIPLYAIPYLARFAQTDGMMR